MRSLILFLLLSFVIVAGGACRPAQIEPAATATPVLATAAPETPTVVPTLVPEATETVEGYPPPAAVPTTGA